MKRTNSDASDEPKAKLARTDASTLYVPALDLPWRFLTATEEGALLIHEWDPKSAKDPAAVATALVRAHAKSVTMVDRSGYPDLYFAQVFEWCKGHAPVDCPVEFEGIDRDDVGKFRLVQAPEHVFPVATTITYHSWC